MGAPPPPEVVAATLTANAARTFASTGGLPGSLAWIGGMVAVFVPPTVGCYRRIS